MNEETGDRSRSGMDPDELVAFLATAPDGLQDWANEQLAQFLAARDESTAGPPRPPQPSGGSSAGADDGSERPEAGSVDDDSAGGVIRQALPGSAAAESAETETSPDADAAVGLEFFVDDFEEASPARDPRTDARPAQSPNRHGPGRVNLVLICLLAAAVVIVIQQLGHDSRPDTQMPSGHPAVSGMPSDHPDIGSMPSGIPSVDQGRINELTARIEADPQNIGLRLELGELYLGWNLYQDALDTLKPILDIDPDHLDGLLAVGVAEYNLEMDAEAERHWRYATEVAPGEPAPWYNLGFLYMSARPPDEQRATEAWRKVIELAPGEEIAIQAQQYLDRMAPATPGPNPSR